MIKMNNHLIFAILLAGVSAVGPMGIDTYIPSIPAMAIFFQVSIEKIELSLSIFLIGFSIGQIFGGPISDTYGRKKSLIIGLLGFYIFSFLIIFSSSVLEFWIYRFFEAFSGGIVVVAASAMVRDKFHGKEAAKVFSLMGTVRSTAPLIAPAVGAFIIHFFSWEVVFIFLTIYPLIGIFFVMSKLEESYTYVKQNILHSFKEVLSHKTAMKAMLILGLGFSGLFIFISKSSFIFIEHFNISTDYFPFYFGINFVGLITMTAINMRLLKSFTTMEIIKVAIFIQTLAGLLITFNYENISLLQTVIFIVMYMSMFGFIFGNGMALALEHFPKNAGVASSVAGVIQFGLGAILSTVVLSFHNETFLPIGLGFTILSFLSYLIIRTYK
ncbi:MAG: Bcr/CflA family drug resistance efflux transporter [Arcobacter sp.]|nr:MAG: Bcr/CflA family drug resistance efflux transporter [Arcobacter sp.]